MRPSLVVSLAVWLAAVAVSTGHPRAASPLPRAEPTGQAQPGPKLVPKPAADTRAAATDQRALVDKYCVTCHNQRSKIGGFTLDTIDLTTPPAGADAWEKVIRKVRGGLMPPVGVPRPDATALAGFASYLETSIDKAASARPIRDAPCSIV